MMKRKNFVLVEGKRASEKSEKYQQQLTRLASVNFDVVTRTTERPGQESATNDLIFLPVVNFTEFSSVFA